MRRAVAVAAALAAALALAGCQGSSARTPTAKRESAIVLRLGVVGDRTDPDGVLAASFAADVARRSDGEIEVRTVAHAAGDGPSLLADARGGGLDLAGVATAAFDRVGLRAFQPLQAPLLITGYPLERQVIDGPVGAAMLAQVESIGLTGLALYERGLQRPLSTGAARLGERGASPRVATPPSGVLAAGWRALGARPREVAPARLAGALASGRIDGTAASLAAIQSQRLYGGAPAVSSNLVMLALAGRAGGPPAELRGALLGPAGGAAGGRGRPAGALAGGPGAAERPGGGALPGGGAPAADPAGGPRPPGPARGPRRRRAGARPGGPPGAGAHPRPGGGDPRPGAAAALPEAGRLSRANLFGIVAMLGWGAAYVPSAWLVEDWPALIAAGARLDGRRLVAVRGRPGGGW